LIIKVRYPGCRKNPASKEKKSNGDIMYKALLKPCVLKKGREIHRKEGISPIPVPPPTRYPLGQGSMAVFLKISEI